MLAPLNSHYTQDAMRNTDPLLRPELVIRIGGGDDWQSSVGSEGEATLGLLAGLRSAQDEATGWNQIVAAALSAADVSAPVNGTVRVRLPLLCETCASYAIGAPETIRLSIPDVAVLSDNPISAFGRVVINASAGTVEVGGSIASSNASELDLVDPSPRTLQLRLIGDLWEGRMGQSGRCHPTYSTLLPSLHYSITALF